MTLDYAFRMGQYTDAQERRRKAASKAEDRAYAIYHELGDIRSDVIVPADVNRLNQLCDALNDAVSEVTAAIYLDKMTKGRELSVRASPVRDQKDATSLPKTASEVEAETERLVRNAQEYQQTARRVLKEVRKDEEAIAIDQEAACHSIYTLTTELSHLASKHEEGRSIPEDANKAVGILGELIKNVTTLYRIKWGLV